MLVKSLFLICFFMIMIAVGFYARKHATNVGDFVLGGRSVGPWLTAFAYGTTYFSAVVFVGYAGQFGWKYGVSATWIGIGNALIGSLLAWVVLGRRTRVMTHHLKSTTMPDFFGSRYNSKALKIAASAISFIFLVPYTASVYNGLSRLFGMAFNVPYWACVLFMAILTCVYVVLGGYMATAINDFIQGIVMLIGIIAVIVAVLMNNGGFVEAISNLTKIPSDIPANAGQQGLYTSFFGPDPINLLGVVILTSLGTWGLPQMIHKFYTIKDEKSIRTGTIISTIFAMIISGGCYFLGGFGRLYDNVALHKEDGTMIFDAIVPHILSSLSNVLIGIVVVLVLSASMSTLASLVMTSSSTLTLDFINDNIVKDMSEKKKLLTMRLLIIFFIVLSVLIALDPFHLMPYIAQLMSISWGALAGSFLAPFLYGLYWKRVTRAAVWASFACGVGLTVSNLFLKYIASPINAGAIAMVSGLLIVPIVSVMTQKLDDKHIDKVFSCYDEKVIVNTKMPVEE